MTIHSFERRYAEADDPTVQERVRTILEDDLEALRVERAPADDDRRGVDFWAYFSASSRRGVDVKNRRTEWRDVLVELVSRRGEGAPGWTVDQLKITDYVLFLWPRHHLLLPYHQLRAAVRKNLTAYREHYLVKAARTASATSDWSTENAAIPEGVLFRDMFGISVPGLPLTAPRVCPSCRDTHPAGTTCAGGWAPWEQEP